MDQAQLNWLTNFIWGIADDVLRDLFKRGKYPDVILPMCVIRRRDAVLESTKPQVLETRKLLDDNGITEQTGALCAAAGQAFYNVSKFTLRDLQSRGSQQQLLADFEDYLNGFSPNVQDILDNFKFRNQLPTEAGGRKPEPELDRLSNILKQFNEQFGTLFTDTDRITRRIREDIAPKVAADTAFQNAMANTPHTARLAHDQALGKVMQHLLKDDTEVYKQFVQNESFKRFVSNMVYAMNSQG